MVAIVKELKRNGEGQQWFDTEVFYSKRDATAYMTKKVETHIKEGFTLKTSKELHWYLLDEEQGDEFEYMVEEKRIHGTPTEHPFHEDISFNMNQILPNSWETEWIDVGAGGRFFTIFKRFVSQSGKSYLIHMDFESMKMVYVIDEARKYNEDRGSFEACAILEPNKIVLLNEASRLVKIND